jgi:hypothetical protein
MCGAEQYGLKSPAVSSSKLPLRPLASLTTLPQSHDGQWPGSLTWRQEQRLALMGVRSCTAEGANRTPARSYLYDTLLERLAQDLEDMAAELGPFI